MPLLGHKQNDCEISGFRSSAFKMFALWDVTQRRLVVRYRRFGTCLSHLNPLALELDI